MAKKMTPAAVRKRYKRIAGRWFNLANQLEEAESERPYWTRNSATGKRLTNKIKRLRPLVNKAWKKAEAALSEYIQAA